MGNESRRCYQIVGRPGSGVPGARVEGISMTVRAIAFALISVAALAASIVGTRADDYPTRTVTIIVPYAAGGTLDTIARQLGQRLSERLGKPFLVENKAGGGTVIGANAVAKAAPDGYTLLMGSSTPLAINATLYKNLPYNPRTDLKTVALIAGTPLVLIVNNEVPVHSVADLIKLAKEKQLSYASASIGSPHHLFMELFMALTRIKMTHIPYRGTPPALTDLMAGQVPVMFCDLISGLQLMRAGKVRAIAAGTKSRLAVLPDIPSVSESGIPALSNFDAISWLAVAVTGGTPMPIQQKLHDELEKIVASESFQASLSKLGLTPMEGGSLAKIDSFVQSEIVRLGDVVRKSRASVQ
jgi:tripartite-type tricarboxylate transporter receptor subunit TctC